MDTCPGILLSEERGIEALEWVRDNSWTGGLYVLVSTRCYSGRVEPEWVYVDRVAPGTASVYPVKGKVRDRGNGQWKFSEVLAVAELDLGEDTPSNWPGFSGKKKMEDPPRWPDDYSTAGLGGTGWM